MRIEATFSGVHPLVDVGRIRQDWAALAPRYDVNRWRLPLPLWAQRGHEHSGPLAWEILQRDLGEADSSKPLCIYLHIPFCTRKCGFCDSYSFKLASHQAEQMDGYIDRLCYELRLWSGVGNLSQRPISTVHLGGGTPTFIGEAALSRIAAGCRENFNISTDTEWALESTVECLRPGMIGTMHDLGFRRLHLGVQSLQSDTRLEIGRRCSAGEVLQKVEATLALDWVVSVDLVCGLPYQTLPGFVQDIQTLITAGVDGFSLYELLIYPQNRKWAEKNRLTDRDHLPNYLMFQAGASLLSASGYQKNLFNHWANGRDTNVYFTFPTRAEDCLAVGTIADGVFGDYHYRHPRYAPYLRSAQGDLPGLEGGLRRTPFESQLQPVTSAILSGHISSELEAALHTPEGQPLLPQWQRHGLIERDPRGGLQLTNSGSWFAGNLIAELTGQGPRSVYAKV